MSDKPRSNSLLTFFVGLILLGVGLFILSHKVIITSGFGWFRLGGFEAPFGLTTVPFIIGLVWMFVQPDRFLPKVVITLGVVFILAALIMSIHFYFVRTTLYEYILIFGMIAAGSGLLLRTLFAPRNKKENNKEN